MAYFSDRELVAYALIALIVVIAMLLAMRHRRRAYWRDLRLKGNGSAKRRELGRRR